MPPSTTLADGVADPAAYPDSPAKRDRWILERRDPRARAPLDPAAPVGAFVERERTERGDVALVATVLLANRECPWRCLMCDLWRHTLPADAAVPPGAVSAQVRSALARAEDATRVKLYNAGSFFDPRAIPPEEHAAIARACARFERVVVESHPALVREAGGFAARLAGDLEVAVGLETIHPEVLPRLQKNMTVDDFRRAADTLAAARVAMRAFVLVGLPFVDRAASVDWAVRSAELAFDCGATAVSLIATRTGNGALDALVARGELEPPTLGDLEAAFAAAVELRRGRVFADLWDVERLASSACDACFPARAARLAAMNLEQRIAPGVVCGLCGDGAGSS